MSNFDVEDIEEANHLKGGEAISTNQVLYNLMRRGIEWNLLPWCRQRGIPIMAYSPIEQGRKLNNPTLKTIAQECGVTAAQVAIAWVLHQDNVIVNYPSPRRAGLSVALILSQERIEPRSGFTATAPIRESTFAAFQSLSPCHKQESFVHLKDFSERSPI